MKLRMISEDSSFNLPVHMAVLVRDRQDVWFFDRGDGPNARRRRESRSKGVEDRWHDATWLAVKSGLDLFKVLSPWKDGKQFWIDGSHTVGDYLKAGAEFNDLGEFASSATDSNSLAKDFGNFIGNNWFDDVIDGQAVQVRILWPGHSSLQEIISTEIKRVFDDPKREKITRKFFDQMRGKEDLDDTWIGHEEGWKSGNPDEYDPDEYDPDEYDPGEYDPPDEYDPDELV